MADHAITCHYVVVDGRTVHYRHVGRGEPVVLLHAAPRSSRALLPLMRGAPAGHAVFAIDLPGFGRSAPLPSDPGRDIAPFGDALAATLDALGLGRVHLYGTHTGAAVGLAFAVRHPARVGALVFDGLSAFTADECAGLDAYLPPFVPDIDGTHMAWVWNRLRDQALFFPWNDRRSAARLARPMPTTDALDSAVVDFVIAADYRQAYGAAFSTDARLWVERLAVPARIGSRPDDVLAGHLDRLGTPPSTIRTGLFAADTATWLAEVWDALQRGPSLVNALAPTDPPIDAARLVDLHRGPPDSRVHWRTRGGEGRPRVLLHASPGSARCLESRFAAGTEPMFACDLPGHGESDPLSDATVATMLDVLEAGLHALGVDDADLSGADAGGWLAQALATRRPGRWRAPSRVESNRTPPPRYLAARADGGHLAAAWLAARDASILGSWWSRDAHAHHDFADPLDVRAIQREAVERLIESPQAARFRRDLVAAVQDLTSTATTSSRSPTLPGSRSGDRIP